MKIAVVGGGVSGLVTAHVLGRDHDITLFEADDRLGGHAHTVEVEVDGTQHAVDTGFIVYNEANYPGFVALLDELGVASQPTSMSFSVTDDASGLQYRGSNLRSLFAQRRNLRRPEFIGLLLEIVRFNRAARRLVAHERPWSGSDRLPRVSDDETEPIETFLARGNYSRAFVEQFLVPFGSAIWSADPATFTQFPMRSYARFMRNHGLLDLGSRPQWRTITGGSRAYVAALADRLAGRARVGTPVHKIVPRPEDPEPCVELLTDRGLELFDRVVVAAHSDQALRMLAEPTPEERAVLAAISYQPNTVTLHTDERLLPSNPRARASWNAWVDRAGRRATVTYWMNSLQHIESSRPLLVTLNRADAIDPARVLGHFEYSHPVFDTRALQAQRRRHEIQGTRGVFFAGAYWGYGFHEDGVQSALEVAAAIGGRP
jgi:predicted NAD/FAD-binding protein